MNHLSVAGGKQMALTTDLKRLKHEHHKGTWDCVTAQ